MASEAQIDLEAALVDEESRGSPNPPKRKFKIIALAVKALQKWKSEWGGKGQSREEGVQKLPVAMHEYSTYVQKRKSEWAGSRERGVVEAAGSHASCMGICIMHGYPLSGFCALEEWGLPSLDSAPF